MNEERSELPELPDFIAGRPCSIGRNGHIRIEDPSLSRGHAELRLVDGKIRLRDLGSTNGTFLFMHGIPIGVDECYVTPDQYVALGSKKYSIKALLAMVGVYLSYSEDVGLVIRTSYPEEKTITIKSDLDEIVSQTIFKMFAKLDMSEET